MKICNLATSKCKTHWLIGPQRGARLPRLNTQHVAICGLPHFNSSLLRGETSRISLENFHRETKAQWALRAAPHADALNSPGIIPNGCFEANQEWKSAGSFAQPKHPNRKVRMMRICFPWLSVFVWPDTVSAACETQENLSEISRDRVAYRGRPMRMGILQHWRHVEQKKEPLCAACNGHLFPLQRRKRCLCKGAHRWNLGRRIRFEYW